MRIIAFGLLLSFIGVAGAQEPTPEEQKLTAEAKKLNEEATQLYRQGKTAEAVAVLRQALEVWQKRYPEAGYPDGHPNLANTLLNLAGAHDVLGRQAQALKYFEEALAMRRRLYSRDKFPDGHILVADLVNRVGDFLHGRGESDRAIPYFEESLAMYRHLYPPDKHADGHSSILLGLHELAVALSHAGRPEAALPLVEEAIAMGRRLYPPSKFPAGHQELLTCLNDLANQQAELGKYELALATYEQALAMAERLYPPDKHPNGNKNLATCLNNLAQLHEDLRVFDKALPYAERALAMSRKLYPADRFPDGHLDVVYSLDNVAMVFEEMGAKPKALACREEALAMCRRLYPASKYSDGHPKLALILNNTGATLRRLDRYEEALRHTEEGLAIRRKLYPKDRYPNGHPELAASLNNVAAVYERLDQPEKGLPLKEESVAMTRRLFPASTYPAGHLFLIRALTNLGNSHERLGEWAKALTLHEEAMTVLVKRREQVIATAPEADALAFVAEQAPARDSLLSTAAHLPGTDERAYRAVWDSKAAVTRVLERRQAAARAAGTEHAVKLERLRANRRETEKLMRDTRRPKDERDRLLAGLADERDRLERELAAALPVLTRWRQRDALGPADLVRLLPPGRAFVDIVRYERSDQELGVKGRAGWKGAFHYAAFVLAPGEPVRRVELGPQRPIDEALRDWLLAIGHREDGTVQEALTKKFWRPIAEQLPAGTHTLFLAPDGDLARMPICALPGSKPGSVLLEDFDSGIAVVPHGPFLLEQLKFPRPRADGPLLALGGLDYGPGSLAALPGAATELKTVLAQFPGDHSSLTGADATAKRIIESLPGARYAHLATHGFFDARALGDEKKRERNTMDGLQEGAVPSRRLAVRNPLGFTGLVLSKGEVLTGLSLVDLPLERLHVATLSACETGLGEMTGGEGVQGLQRAFHMAGCENVVTSLWKVNDDATAALMRRFYFHLWEKKEPPIQALRLAQLELYRNPTQVADLVRGNAPKFSGATKALPKEEQPPAGERSATKLWAAFVLSGVGR